MPEMPVLTKTQKDCYYKKGRGCSYVGKSALFRSFIGDKSIPCRAYIWRRRDQRMENRMKS